jgi:PEP-CTERM motif
VDQLNGKYAIILGAAVLALSPFQANAGGVVTDNMIQLADNGTSASPAQWWLDHDTVTPATDRFVMGGSGKSYNELTVDADYSLTASNGLLVGATNSYYNLLDIQAGGNVAVSGTLKVGEGSISYYSRYNKVNVSGAGAVLAVNGYLDMSNGANATDNVMTLSDGGIAVVNGDFSLYNHWSYGNSWLELAGGELLLSGDQTDDFASGNGILSSIKVWDDINGVFQRVAYYNSTTWMATDYFDYLAVDYIQDATQAAALGYSEDYVDYTVIREVNPVPEPGTVLLLGLGLVGLIGSRIRQGR